MLCTSGLRLSYEKPEFEQCMTSAQQEKKGSRIAFVFRGEAFRGGNLSEYVTNPSEWEVPSDVSPRQFGPLQRLVCGAGAFHRQEEVTKSQLQGIAFLESMGYSVDLFGATYECDEATKADPFIETVQESLPKLYNGRFRRLSLRDKKTSMQITSIRESFHVVTKYMSETGTSYDAVIVGRFDMSYAIETWGCHLADLALPYDAGTIGDMTQLGNDDTLFVVPQQHIKCFDKFLDRDDEAMPRCCYGHCGGGDCHPCVRNFVKEVYGEHFNHTRLAPCHGKSYPSSLIFKPIQPIYSDNPDWLPDSDKDCIRMKNKNNDTSSAL